MGNGIAQPEAIKKDLRSVFEISPLSRLAHYLTDFFAKL